MAMIVYKFGGASVKSADALKQLAHLVEQVYDELVIVISAMGKTTKGLEDITDKWFHKRDYSLLMAKIISYHLDIAINLFPDSQHPVFVKIDAIFDKLRQKLADEPSMDYDYEYDQIVIYGELLSTTIVHQYLMEVKIQTEFIDIRKHLKTDANYRDAKVLWDISTPLILKSFKEKVNIPKITQGFIGSTISNINTTLGREGSDYTASILAFVLDAEKVVTWKDVEGIYNADPKFFDNPQKLPEISYKEAVELTYYGAKIIHPKTIKPLQNKNIPLYVKSFINPGAEGTLIHSFVVDDRLGNRSFVSVPVYIFKTGQMLVSIYPTDFSFIAEENLSRIFALMAEHKIKANMMQHSAISFSVCIDNTGKKAENFICELRKDFSVKYNTSLELITIRHFTDDAVSRVIEGRKILLQQKSRLMARFVVKEVKSLI